MHVAGVKVWACLCFGWLALLVLPVAGCAETPATESTSEAAAEPLVRTVRGDAGGRLVVGLAAEPKTFNPVLAGDNPSRVVLRRMMADLVHIDRASQQTGPALAHEWTVEDDGRRFRLQLRRGIRFSDGEPFDADDVVFTFQVHLDEAIGSLNRDLLIVAGEPIQVRKIDSHTVDFELAAPYAVGDRLFDSLAILPEHLLGPVYREGRFREAWGLDADPASIVGLGPFRLARRVPGERVELERNPHYWKVDEEGQPLPYLDRVVFTVVGDGEAEALRFRAGDLDVLDGIAPESYRQLADRQQSEGFRLWDLGPGVAYTFLVFNLNTIDPQQLPELARRQTWFRQVAFRRAVSLAIDRDSLVRLVYRGLATPIASQVSPGNRLWQNTDLPTPRRDLEQARRLLTEAGFVFEGGVLRDPEGQPVEFSILTSSSNEPRRQMGTIIQQDLAELGIRAQLVTLEFRSLVDRLLKSYDYDLCILGLGAGDVDPNGAIGTVKSDGPNHFWHLGQSEPATPWEAEIDRLMERQLITLDRVERKRLYDRVQAILAEQVPLVFLVSPNVLVGAREGLGNFRPAVLDHPTLWNLDEIFWRDAGRRGPRN